MRVLKGQAVVLAISALTMTTVAGQGIEPESRRSEENRTRRGDTGIELEEVIVTGKVGATDISQFETSYAVSAFDEDALRRVAPLSAADLFTEIPGFWSESSGGESANNLFVRGLALAGAFKFSPLMEDGLPVFEEPEIGFMNADTLWKIDGMTERVEFVRGGPAFIMHSNAVGGAVNAITRKGTDQLRGELKMTYGDWGHLRTDAHVSGPISDRFSYAVGGFYRKDDGIRDPGYTANEGGQIRAVLSYRSDTTEAHFTAKHTDDRNVFYLPIPLLNPKDPKGIPGIDANYGTLNSGDFKVVSLKTPEGAMVEDLEDGIHPKFTTFTALLSQRFGDGWLLQNKLRHVDGVNGFNGIFPRTDPVDADVFLGQYLPQMQAAFPGVTRLEYEFTHHPGEVFDLNNQNGNGLVNVSGWWAAEIGVKNLIDELTVTKQVGEHDLTGGVYYSDYNLDSFISFNDFVGEVRDRPRMLDVVGVNAAGTVVGRLTDSGFLRYAAFGLDARDKVQTTALFLNDNWQLTEDLRLDFGLRKQRVKLESNFANYQSFDLGDGTTLADDRVFFRNGSFSKYEDSFSDLGWTAGANYVINPSVAIFGRYSESFRLPRSEALWFGARANIQYIDQYEVGVKVRTRNLTVFATGFYNRFDGLPLTTQDFDPVTRDVIIRNFFTGTEALGVEIELDWRPFGGNFGLAFAGTLQDPQFKNFTINTVVNTGTGEIRTDDFSGNQANRVPKVMLNLNPYFDFTVGEITGQVYGSLKHVGSRFTDFASTIELYPYETLDMGVLLDIGENVNVQVDISNVTNATGLTEGNNNTGSVVNGQEITFGRPVLGRGIRISASYSF